MYFVDFFIVYNLLFFYELHLLHSPIYYYVIEMSLLWVNKAVFHILLYSNMTSLYDLRPLAALDQLQMWLDKKLRSCILHCLPYVETCLGCMSTNAGAQINKRATWAAGQR